MTDADWKQKLERFFDERAEGMSGVPSLRDHCIVSAKDARVAGREDIHRDLIESLLRQLDIGPQSSVLEVGCASGYIACGLAGHVARYTGVDLAASPLKIAARMGLPNATFQQGDGTALDFPADSFDAAFLYDVYTNFPRFEDGAPILREMLRVVRPGGRVMVGSVTRKATLPDFQGLVARLNEELLRDFGPVPMPATPPFHIRLLRRLKALVQRPEPTGAITTYAFDPEEFQQFGASQNVETRIEPLHGKHPYADYRYNAVFVK